MLGIRKLLSQSPTGNRPQPPQGSLWKRWQQPPQHRGDAICWKDCARCLLPLNPLGHTWEAEPALGQKQADITQK